MVLGVAHDAGPRTAWSDGGVYTGGPEQDRRAWRRRDQLNGWVRTCGPTRLRPQAERAARQSDSASATMTTAGTAHQTSAPARCSSHAPPMATTTSSATIGSSPTTK